MQNATRDLNKVGRQMQSVGRKLTTGITLPLVAAGAAAAKLGVEFDDNMTKIQTLVGVSEDKVKGFRSEVLKLGGKTAKAPVELSDALFTVTSAGLRGAGAMEVLESSAKASAVGLGETKEVARATTAVIQAYGKENITAARSADILTATIREGNLEASELAPVIGRVLPLASQLGISFEEVGASIATFTRLGVDSAEAVTGLRGIMNSLIKPSAGAKDTLAQVGMTFEGLRQEVKDKGLAVTLIGLIKTFKGNDEALASIIPNVRALATVLGTAGAQGKEYQRIVESLTNSQGMLDEAFEKTSKTAGFKLRKALADLKVAGTQFGDVILPVLADLAKRVSEVFKSLQSMNPATKRTIIQVAALAATIGPAVFVVGKMITTVYAAAKAIRIFSLALAASPIGLAVAGISVLAIAFGAFRSAGQALARTTQVVTTELEKQKSEVNSLVNAINQQGISEEKRISLIKELQRRYPDFLGNLKAEEVTTGQLKTKLADFNKEFEKKIALQAREDDLKNLSKAIAENQKLIRVLKSVNDKTKEGAKARANFIQDYFTEEQQEKGITETQIQKELGDQIDNNVRNLERQKKAYNDLLGEVAAFNQVTEKEKTQDTGVFQQLKAKPLEMPEIKGGLFGDLRKMQRELRNTNTEMINTVAAAKTMSIKIVDPIREIGKEFSKIASVKSVFPNFDDAGAKITALKDKIMTMINEGTNPAAVSVRMLKEQLDSLVSIEKMKETTSQLTSLFTNVFDSMLNSGEGVLKSLVKMIGGLIKKLIAAAAAAFVVRAILGDVSAGGSALSGMGKFVGSITGLLNGGGINGSRASGGPVTAGLQYITGEHSKGELFVPNQSGRIYPMSEIQNRGGGARTNNPVLTAVVKAQDLHFMLQNYERRLGRMGG